MSILNDSGTMTIDTIQAGGNTKLTANGGSIIGDRRSTRNVTSTDLNATAAGAIDLNTAMPP